MDRIAREMRQSPEYIASWLNPDGSPGKQLYYLARLEGYLAHREALKGLLQQLGHDEAAQALPAKVPPRGAVEAAGPSTVRRNLTATDVLNILTDARDGKAVPEIMADRGLTKSTVNRWLGKNKWQGESLAQALSRMEGYEVHRRPERRASCARSRRCSRRTTSARRRAASSTS